MSRQWLAERIEKPDPHGDGQPVEIWERQGPSYEIRALRSSNSAGDPVEPFTMSTGSGMGLRAWVWETAALIADGMIGIDDWTP